MARTRSATKRNEPFSSPTTRSWSEAEKARVISAPISSTRVRTCSSV